MTPQPAKSLIKKLFKNFLPTKPYKKYKVLLVGDVCTDVSFFVHTDRENPEDSSVPLFTLIRPSIQKQGMAGNVKNCLEALGLEVRALFPPTEQQSIKARYYRYNNNWDLENREYIFRFDNNVAAKPCRPLETSDFLGIDAVVISDYNKGFIDRAWLDNVQKQCHLLDIPLLVDSKNTDLSFLDHRVLVKVNKKEASELIGLPGNLIVTLGDQGVTSGGYNWPAYLVECKDVCGAGDAFLAGLTYGYLKSNRNKHEAIKYGNANAALSVQEFGTYAPNLSTLNHFLSINDETNRTN